MQISSGASQQGDNITIDANSLGDLQISDLQQERVDDALALLAFSGLFTGLKTTNTQPDGFGVAAGNLSTVDTTGGTGNTDATFDTNKYKAVFIGLPSTPHSITNPGSTGSQVGVSFAYGEKFTCNQASYVISITKNGTCTATRARIIHSGGTTLGTATFSGDVATFSSPVLLTSGETYYALNDKSGAAFTEAPSQAGLGYPVAGTDISLEAGAYNDGANHDLAGEGHGLISIQTKTADGTPITQTIKSVALSALDGAAGAYTQIRLHPYNFVNGASGGNNLKFDVSFNGTSWDLTDLAVDKWNSLGTGITLANMKVRLKINGGTGTVADVPTVQGWVITVA